MRADSKALHGLFQSASLKELVERGRQLMTNPLIVTDLAHRVLEMSTEEGLCKPKWMEISETGVVPLSDTILDVYHRSLLLHKPLRNHDVLDEVDVMRMAISHDAQIIGFIEVPCYNGIPGPEEQELIVFFADVACLIMKRDMGYLYAPTNDRDFFISDLLEGRIKDENTCRSRCKALHWNAGENFRVFTIGPKGENTGSLGELLGMGLQQLSELLPKAVCFRYGSRLKLLVPTAENFALDGRLFDDIISWLKQSGFEAGVSRTTTLLTEIAHANRQSEKALAMGQVLKSEDILFFYDKYSIYDLLESCADHMDIMRFCHSAVFTLADYDRLHQTALLETLRAYLYTGKNVAEASAKLYIHRNTMNNRLQKINDLICTDLEDSENIFHLMLSYHILEYYGAYIAKDYGARIQQNPLLKHQ